MADGGQAGPALGCLVSPPPCHLCSFNRHFLRQSGTRPWVIRRRGLDFRHPEGAGKQASWREELHQDILEVSTPKLGLEG